MRDDAGTVATGDKLVEIDQIAPSVEPARFPLPNAAGWNNSPPVICRGASSMSRRPHGSLDEVEQHMTIGRGRTRVHVKAKYDAKKNQTTIQSEGRSSSKVSAQRAT